jgi:hypothetical protein
LRRENEWEPKASSLGCHDRHAGHAVIAYFIKGGGQRLWRASLPLRKLCLVTANDAWRPHLANPQSTASGHDPAAWNDFYGCEDGGLCARNDILGVRVNDGDVSVEIEIAGRDLFLKRADTFADFIAERLKLFKLTKIRHDGAKWSPYYLPAQRRYFELKKAPITGTGAGLKILRAF